MASDRIPSTDLSDFLSNRNAVMEGINEHIQQLPSCNELEKSNYCVQELSALLTFTTLVEM